MKRTHQLRRIKTKKSYSSLELANLLSVHVQTVRSWASNGLVPLTPNAHRPLFLGQTVKSYLSKLQDARKVKLQESEFYCLRCRIAVTPQSVTEVDRNVLIGNYKDSILLTAHCPQCSCPINKFSSRVSTKQKGKYVTHTQTVWSIRWLVSTQSPASQQAKRGLGWVPRNIIQLWRLEWVLLAENWTSLPPDSIHPGKPLPRGWLWIGDKRSSPNVQIRAKQIRCCKGHYLSTQTLS